MFTFQFSNGIDDRCVFDGTLIALRMANSTFAFRKWFKTVKLSRIRHALLFYFCIKQLIHRAYYIHVKFYGDTIEIPIQIA